MFVNQSVKPTGVMQTATGKPMSPKTLTHIAPAQMYGIEYGDTEGQAHTLVVVRIGNQWFMPPNAEQWASQLQPIAKWLSEQLESQLKAVTDTSVPKADAVDIFGAPAAVPG